MTNCNCSILTNRRFKKAVEKGEIDEQEQKRAHARQSLERYMHYWQRWAENDSSRKKVREGPGLYWAVAYWRLWRIVAGKPRILESA